MGSDICVAVGVLVAILAAPEITQMVLPFVPGRLLDLVAAPEKKTA